MADPKPTVYEAEPHTKAKHQILEAYLKRFFLILSRQSAQVGSSKRLLYVDGFAGAGEYVGAVPGSPLVAIRAAEAASQTTVPIQIKLIEKRHDRVENLRQLIGQSKSQLPAFIQVDDPIEGECEPVVLDMVAREEAAKRTLGPAFFFLDQFGYSSFSMGLVGKILKHPMCEVFSYLNWNLLHPFMADPTKHEGITKSFGGGEWQEVIDLHGREKEDRFRDIYVKALTERSGAKFVYPFAMRSDNDAIIYWLFFSTNNLRGLEEMKRAMWEVDRSGSFEFSDKFASSMGRLFSYDDNRLGNDLHTTFEGQEKSIEDLELFVLTKTPAVNFKTALSNLLDANKLVHISGHARKKDFSTAKSVVKFVANPIATSLFS
jgi:three-Cys-motif partner protein